MSACSAGFMSASSGATVAPSFQPASRATANVQWLPIARAIRSPGFAPAVARASENAPAFSSSSANVSAPLSQTRAGLSGALRAAASRRRTKLSATEPFRRRSL
jgi:hypothetical protein